MSVASWARSTVTGLGRDRDVARLQHGTPQSAPENDRTVTAEGGVSVTRKLTVELPVLVVAVTVEFPSPHPTKIITPTTQAAVTKSRSPFIAILQAADLSATLTVLLATRPFECKELSC